MYSVTKFGFAWHFFTVKSRTGLPAGFSPVHTGSVAETICLGQACCFWAHSSSNTDKSIFEEACPYCFQLQVLDKSGMCLKPKPKLTPKYGHLWIKRLKGMHSIFKKQKLWRGTRLHTVLLMTCQTCTRAVNTMVKGDALYPQWETMLRPHPGRRPQSPALSSTKSTSKGESPASVFRTPTSGQPTPTYSAKDWTKQRDVYRNQKCCTVRKNSKRIHSGFQKFLLSSLKNGFWVMSKAASELQLVMEQCLTFIILRIHGNQV